MTTIKIQDVRDGHKFRENPVFITKEGRLFGMVRRSDFNNLYPIATDRVADFEGFPQTLRLTDVAIFLESKGYQIAIEG